MNLSITSASEQFEKWRYEFLRGGASIVQSRSNNIFRVGARDMYWDFSVPALLAENRHRIPGWFLAGMWDKVDLADFAQRPHERLLLGFDFRPDNLYKHPIAEPDKSLWSKPLSEEKVQWLLYEPSTGELSIRNNSAGSKTEVGPFPTKSVFHALKLFEENGWFNKESSVQTLDINDYIVR